MPKRKSIKFYAVAKGRQVGIFNSWTSCEPQVKGFSGAVYKSFTSHKDAETYLQIQNVDSSKRKAPPSSRGAAPSTKRAKPGATFAEPAKQATFLPTTDLTFHVSFDGGSRGNPGLAGCGAEVIFTCRGKDLLIYQYTKDPSRTHSKTTELVRTKTRICRFLRNHSTNNQAEYWGLVSALYSVNDQLREWIGRSLPYTHPSRYPISVSVIVQGDSNLVIQQMKQNFKVKTPSLLTPYRRAMSHIRRIREACEHEAIQLREISFEHVYRKDNKIADGT